MTALRILIADDHEMVRQGLRGVLSEVPGWQVCGEATDGLEVVAQAERLRPDIVILDLTMPKLNGQEACRQIRNRSPRSEILVLTMHDSHVLARKTMEAGARGFVLKNDAGRVLVDAVAALSRHESFVSARLAAPTRPETPAIGKPSPALSSPCPPVPPPRLTPRQREIVQQVAEGLTNKEIAARLGISVRTAETHRLQIMRKFRLRSVPDLVRFAVRHHLIVP